MSIGNRYYNINIEAVASIRFLSVDGGKVEKIAEIRDSGTHKKIYTRII